MLIHYLEASAAPKEGEVVATLCGQHLTSDSSRRPLLFDENMVCAQCLVVYHHPAFPFRRAFAVVDPLASRGEVTSRFPFSEVA